MGKHSGNPDPNEITGLTWHEGATEENKADNFDAYDKYLTDNAGPDTSNPYSKENFGK